METLVELSIGERRVKAPVLGSPGHADFAISLAVGYYGSIKPKTRSVRVLGFDAYPLMSSGQSLRRDGSMLCARRPGRYPACADCGALQHGGACHCSGRHGGDVRARIRALRSTREWTTHIPENRISLQGAGLRDGGESLGTR